ncbi:MAG TPA: phosphohistidine phosphatase SixA [Bryobacteraceae bacterium]|nr:phosphohistidine phosphatase SixA [Bryobacteraceae bacterium]
MDLYLLRHGIAENGRPGMPDAERELTPEGRKKLREVMRVARAAGVQPDYVLTSPYARALQTAEIAAQILEYSGELLHTQALVPHSRPELVWDEVRIHRDAAQLLLVGHEPLFSNLASFLLDAPSLRVDFKKGALLRIEIDQLGPKPRGVLRWFISPKMAGAKG